MTSQNYHRRKFRSQTSDNMDRWKAEMGRVREEKRRRKKIKKRKSQKKEDPGARKGRKAAKHSVFPMICGSGGSKSRLAKAVGAEPAGQMRDEKLHAVVARSTFRSQNLQSKLRWWKSAHCCGAKHISKSKCTKHQLRSTFSSCDDEKVHAIVALSAFRNQKCKKMIGSEHFWTFGCRFAWQAQGIMHLVKSEQHVRVCRISKNDGRRGTFEEDLARCIFRGRPSARDMFIRDVRRPGRWFPERGRMLEHQIFSFGKMISRDRCSASYDLASLFRGRHSNLDRRSRKKRKTHWYEAVSSALNFPFLKEVLQNCFVFDVVNLKSEEVSQE